MSKKKFPTFIKEPHATLAGIFNEIPCNRKARRMQGKIDKKFYPARIKPIVKKIEGWTKGYKGRPLKSYWRTK